MNAAQLQAFRDIADAMQTKPADWQWIGPHMSQRMFGITQERAEAFAARHGGEARKMETGILSAACRKEWEGGR
jgi:copper oxidase (laccase) domain-containing protein